MEWFLEMSDISPFVTVPEILGKKNLNNLFDNVVNIIPMCYKIIFKWEDSVYKLS